MKPYLHTLCVMLILIGISYSNSANAQTIAITETNPSELLCSGQPIEVSYNLNGTFNAGNVFQIQLSDKTGSFTAPTSIGSYSWSGVATAQNLTTTCVIPTNIAAGTGYRIRIVSTSPAITGANTFKQFIISNRCGCNTDLIQKDWELSLGGSGSDQLLKIVSVRDGGFLLAGTSSSMASGNKTVSTNGLGDYYVTKIDSNRNILWQFSYGGTQHEELKSAIQTADGGYLLVGISQSGINGNKTAPNNGNYDIWVVKLSATGFKSWDRTFGGSQSDFAYDVKTTEDGSYLIVGSSLSMPDANKTSPNYGGYDYWIIKVNTSGVKIWENTYGGTSDESALRVATKSNGNIVLGGYSRSASGSGVKTSTQFGLADYWLVEINGTGTLISQNSYGGTQDDIFQDMILTSDDNMILTGTSESGVSGNKTTVNYGLKDMWIVKANGASISWQKTYGTTSIDPSMCLKEASDGSYLISGSAAGISGNKTSIAFGSTDMWVISLEANGDEIIQESFGGINGEQANAMTYTSDGGFIIAGFSQSTASGNKTTTNYGAEDYWIVKLKILPMKYTLNQTVLCRAATDTTKVKINCNNLGTNPIQVQLSDAAGNFTSPTILGSSLPSATNVDIPYSIPNSVAPGTYKIRVIINSSPSFIGDTISNIIVNESPTLSGVNQVCNIGKNFQAVGLQSYATKQWQLNGSNISGETNDFIYPTNFGTYKLSSTVGSCLVNSNPFTVAPANTNATTSLSIADGAERFLCDNTTAEVIAKVKDNVGGNVLGATTADLFIDATLQSALGQPYARRHWDITPVSSGAAKVTIYIQQSDFTHYNTNVHPSFNKMPENTSDIAGMNNLIVMQCHGTSVSKLPGTYSGTTEFFDKTKFTLTWNAAINMWELSFNATAFSGIYLITMQASTLPVELISFTGNFIESKSVIQLNWSTASELNNQNFEVERMDENNQFIKIGEVDGSGNSSSLRKYTFDDKEYVNGDNYYRLKQNDYDGNYQYSDIILIRAAKEETTSNTIKVWMNQQTLTITAALPVSATVYNLNGQIAMLLNSNETQYNTDLSSLPNGVYVVYTTDVNGNKQTFKIVK
jgi:hypothetical protein